MNTENNTNETNNITLADKLDTHIALLASDETGFSDEAMEQWENEEKSFKFFLEVGEFERADRELTDMINKMHQVSLSELFRNTFRGKFKKIKKNKGKVVLDIDKVPCNKTRILWGLNTLDPNSTKFVFETLYNLLFMHEGIKIKSVKIIGNGESIAKISRNK